MAAGGEAVEEDEAEGEDVHALALAHLLPAAAEQLLRRLPPAASACTLASLYVTSRLGLKVCLSQRRRAVGKTVRDMHVLSTFKTLATCASPSMV